MYDGLSCQGVRVVGGVRTIFRIYVLSTSPYSERRKFCDHFFKSYPYKPYCSFISFSNKREKKIFLTLLHFLHYYTIDQSVKLQKCKRYGVLHYEGWAGFNSSNSFSLLFIVGFFFSEATGFSISSLQSLDSHQTKWKESR